MKKAAHFSWFQAEYSTSYEGWCEMTLGNPGRTEQQWIIAQSVKAPRLLTWRQELFLTNYLWVLLRNPLPTQRRKKRLCSVKTQSAYGKKKPFSTKRRVKYSPIYMGCGKVSLRAYYDPTPTGTDAADTIQYLHSTDTFLKDGYSSSVEREAFSASAANLDHPTRYYPCYSQGVMKFCPIRFSLWWIRAGSTVWKQILQAQQANSSFYQSNHFDWGWRGR